MTPFAVVVVWDDREPAKPISWRSALLADRAIEEETTVTVPGAVGTVGVRPVLRDESAADGVFVDQGNRRLFVGDVRLYDRASLVARVGEEFHQDSDLALVARAFERFGDRTPEYLVGDFAVVVFHWETKQVVAFRDHFGVRPLYYRLFSWGTALASDMRQLLALEPSDRELDRQTVFNYLLSRYAHHGRTFFASIRQAWPGNLLRIGPSGGVRQARYWHPPSEERRERKYEDVVEEWRAIFGAAVTARIKSDYPLAAYLSGGLDSGSIVGAAHGAYASDAGWVRRPSFTTLSALFPGLPSDESELIDAVTAATPLFAAHRWDGTAPNTGDLDISSAVMPRGSGGIGRSPRSEFVAINEKGIRIVLGGTGGDEIGWTNGIGWDLLKAANMGLWASEVRAAMPWRRVVRYLKAGFGRVRPPQLPTDVPLWMGYELARLYPGDPDTTDAGTYSFASNVQREAWTMMQLPQAARTIDLNVMALGAVGVEFRLPYRDIRLADFVLRVPWTFRIPQGDVRRLQRDAIRPFLPGAVAERRAKSFADSAIAHHTRLSLPRIQAMLVERRWESAPFVVQKGARGLVREMEAMDPKILRPRAWLPIWQLAVFEAWLRRGPGL